MQHADQVCQLLRKRTGRIDQICIEEDQFRARLRALGQQLNQAPCLAHPSYCWDAVCDQVERSLDFGVWVSE